MGAEKIKNLASQTWYEWGGMPRNRIWSPAVSSQLKPKETRKFPENVVEKIKILHRKRGTKVMKRTETEFEVAGSYKRPKIENRKNFPKIGSKKLKFCTGHAGKGDRKGGDQIWDPTEFQTTLNPPKNARKLENSATTSERYAKTVILILYLFLFTSLSKRSTKESDPTYAHTRRIRTRTTHTCTQTTSQQTVAYRRSCTYVRTRTHKDLAKAGP